MWITRDKNDIWDRIYFWIKKPDKKSSGSYYGVTTGIRPKTDEFKKAFPKVKLPRKGSCREIKGLAILEK